MFKVLGGIGRSVPLYNGKARILVKAIIPVASSYLADMQSICEANGWKSVLDERISALCRNCGSETYGLQKSVFGRWCCVLRCSRIRRLTL